MAEKKSNKPTFTFIKTERPAPKGELQKMAREYERELKEKKAKRRKKVEKYESKKVKEKFAGFSKGGEVLKAPTGPGLKKLPTEVRNKMGYMKAGGKVGYSKGGIVDRQYLKGR